MDKAGAITSRTPQSLLEFAIKHFEGYGLCHMGLDLPTGIQVADALKSLRAPSEGGTPEINPDHYRRLVEHLRVFACFLRPDNSPNEIMSFLVEIGEMPSAWGCAARTQCKYWCGDQGKCPAVFDRPVLPSATAPAVPEEVYRKAERYHWLRSLESEWSKLFADPVKWDGGSWVRLGSHWTGAKLDEVIDAAMTAPLDRGNANG